MSLFGQVWLWSLLAFFLGAGLMWPLFVRPLRKQIDELETDRLSRVPGRATAIPPAWNDSAREDYAFTPSGPPPDRLGPGSAELGAFGVSGAGETTTVFDLPQVTDLDESRRPVGGAFPVEPHAAETAIVDSLTDLSEPAEPAVRPRSAEPAPRGAVPSAPPELDVTDTELASPLPEGRAGQRPHTDGPQAPPEVDPSAESWHAATWYGVAQEPYDQVDVEADHLSGDALADAEGTGPVSAELIREVESSGYSGLPGLVEHGELTDAELGTERVEAEDPHDTQPFGEHAEPALVPAEGSAEHPVTRPDDEPPDKEPVPADMVRGELSAVDLSQVEQHPAVPEPVDAVAEVEAPAADEFAGPSGGALTSAQMYELHLARLAAGQTTSPRRDGPTETDELEEPQPPDAEAATAAGTDATETPATAARVPEGPAELPPPASPSVAQVSREEEGQQEDQNRQVPSKVIRRPGRIPLQPPDRGRESRSRSLFEPVVEPNGDRRASTFNATSLSVPPRKPVPPDGPHNLLDSGLPQRPKRVAPMPNPVPPAAELGAVGERPEHRGRSFGPRTPFGVGSALPKPDGSPPSEEYEVKASMSSRRYYTAQSPYFGQARAEVWFRTPTDAEQAGFTPGHHDAQP